MTSLFVLGGSSPSSVLEDELVAGNVDGVEVEDCIPDENFKLELDAEVEGAGLSSWFLSFSRRCFRYNVLFITESDLWCPVAVDSTCSAPEIELTTRREPVSTRPTSSQPARRVRNWIVLILQSRQQKPVESGIRRPNEGIER